MKNRFRDLNTKAKFHLEQLMEEIHHVAYNEGYEAGHAVGKQESIEGVRPLTTMFDELFEKPKSANEQRAELIQKAKDFVEAMKCGEGNVFDKVGRLSRLEFYRKNNRVTCVINPWDNYSKRSTGRATCSQGDVFNEHIGQAIAFAKAKNISIPVEFLEAVQPDEVVVGMEIQVAEGKTMLLMQSNPDPLYPTEKIIDDTNAQYEIPS